MRIDYTLNCALQFQYDMTIRKTESADIETITAIYEHARAFMAEHGNPTQWGPRKWPPRELILEDVEQGKSYVCEQDGQIAGTFFYDSGTDVESTYRVMEGGSWSSDQPYGVIHRIASAGTVRGLGKACIGWALQRCGYLRIDTHKDNVVMRNLLEKSGFRYCGIIYVENGTSPRLAYDIIRNRNEE